MTDCWPFSQHLDLCKVDTTLLISTLAGGEYSIPRRVLSQTEINHFSSNREHQTCLCNNTAWKEKKKERERKEGEGESKKSTVFIIISVSWCHSRNWTCQLMWKRDSSSNYLDRGRKVSVVLHYIAGMFLEIESSSPPSINSYFKYTGKIPYLREFTLGI